jgi:hypothetical protein
MIVRLGLVLLVLPLTIVNFGCSGSVAPTPTVNAAAVAPMITTQPASQTVPVGQPASFSVTATGTGLLSYHWNKNGTAISGATSSSYTTPATTSSDSGALFTVVVSDAAGSITSNTATLTLSGTGPGTASTINVLNYGATGNGSTDDTAAINTAIAAMAPGDTLLFPCGHYLITSQLSISTANVTIDGSNCAVIQGAVSSGNIMVVGNGLFMGSYGPAVALNATANELDTSFTTVSNLGVAAGDYIYISQGGKDYSTDTAPGHDTGCDVSGCRRELLKVASVSGNSITVTTALHDTYNPFVNAAVARKVLNPITGMTVKNIALDGSGTENYGLLMLGVVDSTVSGVTSKNVVFTALYGNSNFNLAWNNVTVSGAGNRDGTAMSLWVQGNPSVNGASISNLNPGSGLAAFGFEVSGAANGTFTNITIDASGAYGRPVKVHASRYNTFNSLTSKNGTADYNGIALNYYSSHNTFNRCVVMNNGTGGTGTGNAGINTFGNFNQYNSFNNCTVSGNGNVQLYISGFDDLRLAQDSHNTVSGGTFTGSNSAEAVLLIEGDSAYITGATISGPGAQGIYLDSLASNACVNNNTFTLASGLGTAISANGSNDMGFGNLLNLLASNLIAGTCGTPLP